MNQYLEKADTQLPKRSIQIFGELNDAELLEVIDKRERSNVYSTTRDSSGELTDKLTILTDGRQVRNRVTIYGQDFDTWHTIIFITDIITTVIQY